MPCEKLKCGHCKETGWIPDQCGKPEHYYCIYCKLKEDSDETDIEFGTMMDERDKLLAALKQVMDIVEIGKEYTDRGVEDPYGAGMRLHDIWGVVAGALRKPDLGIER